MGIRKQLYELKPTDFETSPVWEFALDEEGEEGQDEATVRPYDLRNELDPTEGMFAVKARFQAASGVIYWGFPTPPTQAEDALGTIQPIIVTDHGHVNFWCGIGTPSPEDISRSYSLLSTEPSLLFPLAFESAVPLTIGIVKGEIQGFTVLEDIRTHKTRL